MQKIWSFIKKRKWWIIGAVVILLIVLASGGQKSEEYIYGQVERSDVSETILATGQVVSNTDLELSFSRSGIVNSINSKVGDFVSRGKILASLKNQSESASLTQAQAALDRAQASYRQLLEGATSEEIEIARVALRNTEIDLAQSRIQQDRLVENAHRALLSGDLVAIPTSNTTETAPVISGTYIGEETGVYTIRVYSSGAGKRFSVGGLETADGIVDETRPILLGTRGLFVQFSSDNTTNTNWSVSIPNTRGASYVTNLNVYGAAEETRDITLAVKQSAVDTAQANLNDLLAAATGPELDLAASDILSAEGQVSAALAVLEDTRVRAPESGTITRIDISLGELVQAYKSSFVLQDTEQLLLEANVNEANITKVTPGMLVEVTFDAFSFDQTFMAEVVSVDIASTLVSGVVNYRIKAVLKDELPYLRPGMTANMTLIVDKKEDVLSVPGRSVIEKEDGSKYILTKDGKENSEVLVEIGFEGDGTIVEVLSGLSEGDEIVVNP